MRDRHYKLTPEPLSEEARKILTGGRDEMIRDATERAARISDSTHQGHMKCEHLNIVTMDKATPRQMAARQGVATRRLHRKFWDKMEAYFKVKAGGER